MYFQTPLLYPLQLFTTLSALPLCITQWFSFMLHPVLLIASCLPVTHSTPYLCITCSFLCLYIIHNFLHSFIMLSALQLSIACSCFNFHLYYIYIQLCTLLHAPLYLTVTFTSVLHTVPCVSVTHNVLHLFYK